MAKSVAAIGATGLVALALLASAVATADEYENKCVAAASEKLPRRAELISAETSKPSPALLARYGRDQSIRWVKVVLTSSVVGRQSKQSYICSLTRGGIWFSMPVQE